MKFDGNISSKQPNAETSIFAIMSKLAIENEAINLSQGFPDFGISEDLMARVNFYMKSGFNQYAPMPGVESLRKSISEKVKMTYNIFYNHNTEINITAGATQALYTAIAALVKEEDEVIIFEPAYDLYAPAVRIHGGIVKYVQMVLPDYHIDWDQVRKLISGRTRMIIINSPHNPTGAVLSKDDLIHLEKLTAKTDIIILSDEVYEHLIYDNIQHESICRYPELAKRSLVVGSFGKTFHATGWKVGYILAPENLIAEFRKVHQWVVFAVNTPVQMAIADTLSNENSYIGLPAFFQQKRDLFLGLIKTSRFTPVPSYGTYFQCLNYGDISQERDLDFAKRLTREMKIASIPLSSFFMNGRDDKILRFCFAKKEETLRKAAEILCRI